MSDSEADIPSEAAISRALRDVVVSIHKSGKEEDLTVKRVRTRAEDKLGLPSGFFQHEDWKQKSKEFILEAVNKYCSDEPAPTSPKPKAAAKKTKPDNTRGVKRKAAAPPKKAQQKRRKTALSDEDSELSDVKADEQTSDAESEPPKKIARRQKKVLAADSDEEEDGPPLARANGAVEADSDAEEEVPAVQSDKPEKTPPLDTKDGASDSDMSSLIDESPVKKRQKKTPVEKGSKGKPKAAKAKAAPKPKSEDDPDQAEIRRLQSWLVKCGIRKVWGKELASCDTSKEKIRHLKGMLKDAGMDGKYSNEKAAQIKEKREFAKDLEETQAGALAWGASEKADIGRPRRRAAAKPIPKPLVLSDDDDEGDAEEEKDATDDDIDDEDDESVKGESEEEGDDDIEDLDSD